MVKHTRGNRLIGPNLFPEHRSKDAAAAAKKVEAAMAAAAAVSLQGTSCRFLGHDFAEGETICYRDEVWVCSLGQWARTGVRC